MASIAVPAGGDASPPLPEISTDTFTVCGIRVHVQGLDKHGPNTPLTCVHLLHGRLCTHKDMSRIARALLSLRDSPALVCASFDARNHGEREAWKPANHSWKDGNPSHAIDLFSMYHGTALDLALVVDYLPVYLRRPLRHIAVGFSLGGHAAFLALDIPNVCAAAAVVGCVDYTKLMMHRAEKSRVDPASVFAHGLAEVVKKVDPAARGAEAVSNSWQGKKVLAVFGGADPLVPYDCSREFLREVRDLGVVDITEVVIDGVGHVCTDEMGREVARFVVKCAQEP